MRDDRSEGANTLTWVRESELQSGLQEICDIGYSPHDIITTFFRVVKLSPELPEFLKLEFIRVCPLPCCCCCCYCVGCMPCMSLNPALAGRIC